MKKCLVILACATALTGCLHGRGVHSIPVTRDYQSLEKVTVKDADPIVATSHRVGGHVFSPYEATAAEIYLDYAYDARDEGDRKGHKDYAGLAKMFAEQAIANGGIADKGEMPMPKNHADCLAEFERLKARYQELDPCKAKVVAPVQYAHLEANLAQAEHELMEKCNYPDAARHLRNVEPDIDAIWAHDIDGDGITDMHDGEPWKAEDADGFQDEDGIPEPKPYPILESVHFASDSARLSADAKGYLRGVADMLIDGYKEVTVYLSAHTDSDASEAYNQQLSMKREAAVRDYLIEAGAKQAMVMSSHHGESQPVADNSSSSGKAQNRRVEIKLDAPDPVSPFCQN